MNPKRNLWGKIMENRIELLLEKFLTAYQGPWGDEYFEIFVNPTKREMKDIQDKHRNIRFIADSKKRKVYVFSTNSLHRRTWDEHIAPETGDSRKMYSDETLFGGAMEGNTLVNYGVQDGLYPKDVLAEWVLHPDVWKFAQKWFDIQGWIADQEEDLEWEGGMQTKW
jgi:hypothetical protein